MGNGVGISGPVWLRAILGVAAVLGCAPAYAQCDPVAGEYGSLLVVDLSSCGAQTGPDAFTQVSAQKPMGAGMSAPVVAQPAQARSADQGQGRTLREDVLMYSLLAAGFLIVGRQMRRRRGPRVVLS